MLNLPLEPTDDRANPAFKTVAECTRWLNQLQLTNLQLAHSKLLVQLSELNRYPMRATERLPILEALRETVEHVQRDYGRKLIAKPLLLNDAEYIVFVGIVNLWQAMVTGYQRCLQDYLSGDRSIGTQGALLSQRCLLYSGLEIFEYLRTGYDFDSLLWEQLHTLYAFTEERKFHQTPVMDTLHQANTTCCTIYVKTLLSCDAHPAELSRSQLRLLDGWLTDWSREIKLERYYSITAGDAVPLAVDLSSTKGLYSATDLCDNDQIRYLALVPLSKLLRIKIILLEQGASTEKVGLGSLSDPDECRELLIFLHKCWCESHSERVRPPRNVGQVVHVCYQLEQIFGQLTGKAFEQPHRMITAANRDARETFERVEVQTPSVYQPKNIERWQVESDGLLNVQVLREGVAGQRLHHAQLIALRADGAQRYMLAVATWLKVTRTGRLQMGARYLPGVPEAIWVRHYGLNQGNELYQAAFLLPALRELNIPSSLLVMPHFFQAGRVLEMLTPKGIKMTLKMGLSVERGADYERVSFEPCKV